MPVEVREAVDHRATAKVLGQSATALPAPQTDLLLSAPSLPFRQASDCPDWKSNAVDSTYCPKYVAPEHGTHLGFEKGRNRN